MDATSPPRWWVPALVVGYVVSVLLVGVVLNDSNITVGTAALFLLPSLVFGALIAQWWALVLPMLLGVTALVYDLLIVCQTDCFDDLLGDLPTVLVFVLPSAVAMLIGVAVGKAIRWL